MSKRFSLALGTLAAFCLLWGSASAERVSILKKPYTATTMKRECLSGGGSYFHNSGAYGCNKSCKNSQGQSDTCTVTCTGTQCKGITPD